jgi:Kef-type K+ transport system membrane component KefB
MNKHYFVLSIVTVAGLGVGPQWLASRLKMPAIVLLAAAGPIMGPGLDLEAGDTIGYFARAQQLHSTEIADAPAG